MTEQLPDPLVPSEVDLSDFQYMELDVQKLRDSRFAAEVEAEAFRAGVLLWCASWHQVPAASLPNNDTELSQLAGFGRVVKEWKKVREQALQLFVLCNDGRLYHRIVAEKALAAWDSKLHHQYDRLCDRMRKVNKTRSDKGLQPIPVPSFDAWKSAGKPAEIPAEPPAPSAGLPAENALRGNRTERNGEGTERNGDFLGNTAELRSAGDDEPPAVDRPPLVLVEPTPELPDCPHQDLIALYRKHLPHLRQPARWDGERAEAMRTRWRECAQPTSFGDGYRTKAEGLAFWDRFFAYVATVPKLRDGITTREAGQVRVWKPSLDWLVIRSNFTKVIEGAYAE